MNLDQRSTTAAGDVISPYVAPFVLDRVASHGALDAPERAATHGAILLADVSGFTALTETLAAKGAAGAERLRDLINDCFSQLIDTVTGHDGEIVHFAGDAVLAVWFSGSDDDALPAVSAMHCAEEIRNRLDGREVGGHRIRLRSGIGQGAIDVSYVGGVNGRWQYLLSGSAVEQAVSAVAGAHTGSVNLSSEARAVIDGASAAPGNGESRAPVNGIATQDTLDGLRAFVPGEVQSWIDAGQADWLAEFRQITTLFANLDVTSVKALDALQGTITCMQEAVYEFGGSVLQILVEDKGLTLLAAWGTTQHFHEDNAARAVRAARAIEKLLAGRGLGCRLGLTTGTAFLGVRGNQIRKEFAVVGNVINLAARLMQASNGDPLCDAATRAASRRHFNFEALPPMTVKGRLEQVPVYRTVSEAPREQQGQGSVIGREHEARLLSSRLSELEAKGRGGLVLIEGLPGIGKSHLVGHLLEETQSSHVRSLVARGDPLGKSTTYQPWRNTFERLMGLSSASSTGQREAAVREWFQSMSISLELAALMNPVIGCDFPQSDRLAQMLPLGRAERTQEILLGILRGAIERHPTLLVFEDAHWFDSASVALVRSVVRTLPGALCVVVAREIDGDEGLSELRLSADGDHVSRIGLEPFSQNGTLQLVCSLLNVDLVPESVVQWIHRQAGGHPFFTEQLTRALRDEGRIRVQDGECRLCGSVAELQQVKPPDSVQNLVTSRIDRLAPDEKLVLKVASVAGNSIDTEMLVAIYPIDTERSVIVERLRRLCALGWLIPDGASGPVAYQFGHAVARDIAYESLSFAQRRRLHESAARWLEEHAASSGESLDPLLAHHFGAAGMTEQAFACLERAGLQALRDHANVEAAYFFSRALELDDSQAQAGTGMDSLRRARWHRLLGDAHFRMWDFGRATENLEQALRMLDHPFPTTGRGRAVLLLGQLCRQAVMLLRPARHVPEDSTERQRDMEAAGVASLMSFIATHRRNGFETMVTALLAANLSERAGAPNPRALALLGLAAGALGLQKLARRYFDRAQNGARQAEYSYELPNVIVLDGNRMIGLGELDRAERLLLEGIAIAQERGDNIGTGDLMCLQSNVAARRGDLSKELECNTTALELVEGLAAELQLYFRIGLLFANTALLPPDEAYLYLLRVQDDLRSGMQDNDKLLLALLTGWTAVVHARVGRVASSCSAADEAMGYLADNIRAVPPSCWQAIESPAEAYLDCWELVQSRQLDDPPAQEIFRKARKATEMLHRWSRLYPISRARDALLRGRVEWISGRPKRAISLWQTSLEAAREMQLPVDEALARLELGRHDAGDGKRDLVAACEAFNRLGQSYYLERSREALNERRQQGQT